MSEKECDCGGTIRRYKCYLFSTGKPVMIGKCDYCGHEGFPKDGTWNDNLWSDAQ